MRLSFILVAGLLIAADAPKEEDAAKKEMERLQGTWVVESLKGLGESWNEAKDNVAFIFASEKLMIEDKKAKKKFKFIYRLNPTKRPHEIDLLEEKEPDLKTYILRGIYRWNGDKLTLCLSSFLGIDVNPRDFPRPKEFESDKAFLITLKREKR